MRFFLILFISLFLYVHVSAVTIPDIEHALNKYTSLVADFKQHNSDGSLSSGTFHLERPGRLKFTYDHPAGQLIMTKNDWLVLYDPKLNEGTYIEIEHTPAHILLKNTINLTDDVTVQNIHETQAIIYVSLTIQGHEMTLLLNTDTLGLSGWIAFDIQGGRTHVMLENHTWETPIPPETWVYKEPSKWQKNRT